MEYVNTSIVHGILKGGVFTVYSTKKFWFLKPYNDEHVLN